MSAYWIAHVDVTDEDTYKEYAKLATAAVAEHGGRFLARGGRYECLEGNCRPRNVVIEFPTMEAAVGCYKSASYAKALEFSSRSSDRDMVIVEGAA